MFKLESYITPILLSYVDKYINNFRPEDSQVSLWGGDALFHNLDLRLEVLEQELQLPFSFMSGHIHELQIHVPWTKLASEPITITINTIECILKLRGDSSQGSDSASQANVVTNSTRDSRRKTSKRQDVVAPSGYVQSLVNKIVSNITIYCKNLILKYVEEDIVLSVNVKTVTLQSANELWQPTFTEISPLLRKLISLADLTICLDKRNASGKIEMYQEPLLYRCSLDIHLLRSYHSATAKRASVTRVDIHCTKMDFSVTEQQIPMLMRLALLGLALHARELVPQQSPSVDPMDDAVPLVTADDDEAANESWAGWAWSFIPSILPYYFEEDWNSDQQIAYGGHTYHTGFYVKRASVTLKITETTPDRSYYGPRKVKFIPFLAVQLQGCFMEFIMQGVGWLNAQIGVSRATVQPSGECFCGVKDVPSCSSNVEGKDNDQEVVYFTAGSEQMNYIAKSLFDPESQENKGRRRMYNASWDYHLSTVTEDLLLERSPAIAIDYLYMLEVPDDLSSEPLSDLVSDLEYSNLPEKSICRIVVGPTAVKLCSGLFHRLQMVHHYAKVYDYPPYSIPKSDTNPDHLHPPTLEEFELLEQNIPKQVYQLTLFKPVIHIILADHPVYDPLVLHAPRKRRKKLTQIQPLTRHIRHLPKVTLECDCLDAKVVKPMYPRRLVSMTSQHPSPPQHVFHACHFHTDVKLLGVNSQLVLGPGNQTIFLMPSNVTFTKQNLVLPNYWNNMDIPHVDQTLKADSLTVTCTKAKLMVIVNVIQSQFNPSSAVDIIQNSTLLTDAEKHIGVEYLELCVEGVTYRHVVTPGTEAFSVIVGSVKAFVLEFPLKHNKSDVLSESQQALVLSGPDNSAPQDMVQHPLLNLTMQCTKSPDNQDHPPVIIFNLREVRACVDPMMWEWLRYSPARVSVRYDISHSDTLTSNGSTVQRRNRRLSSESTIGAEASVARRAPTPQESVHSSSDRDQLLSQAVPPLSPVPHSRITQSESEKQTSVPPLQEKETIWSRSNLLHWFPVWRGLVLSGDMAQCVVYLPTTSLSAVGSHSIEDALAHCLQNKTTAAPEVLVITFPFLTLRSAARKQDLHQYTARLPVKLPENIWTKSKLSFPWSLAVSDMSCYTLQNGSKLHFLKPVSANATVGISAKYQNDKSTLASLGFCVHVDTTPVKISVSQEQVNLMTGVLVSLLEFSSSLQFFTFSNSEVVSAPVVNPPLPPSPTLFPESSGSRESPSTPFKTQESIEQQNESVEQPDIVKMTVLMQSTLARLTVSMYAESPSPSKDDLKLVIDMEDIMNSLDFQQVYLKVKCKVALANIKHYIRKKKGTEWALGPHVGLVMRGHEDVATSPAVHREMDDGGGFLSLTFTRAKCRNVHSRWGTRKQTTLLANSNNDSCQVSVADKISARYISEIVVKLQAVDFVFSASTLGNFLVVLYPILMMPECKDARKTSSPAPNWMLMLNNRTLPLLYLDTHSIRVILPAAELTNMDELHDVCLLQVDAITLTPQADNPLGRVVLRTDIYHMAEQSRMLCVPGSDVEDRQYQIDITGFSINTSIWKELDSCLGLTSSQPTPALHTMSENPALEWNNLVSGKESIMPHMSLLPVISRLNLCIVAAPAIVYRGDVLVCGHSLEVNAVTDIEISVSTGQLLLASALATEIMTLFKPLLTDSASKVGLSSVLSDATNKSLSAISVENKTLIYDSNRFVDSGVDCAEASSASFVAATGKTNFKGDSLNIDSGELEANSAVQQAHQNVPFRQLVSDSPFTEAVSKYSVSSRQGGKWNEHHNVPVEVLLTAGKISCVLYELKDGPNTELHTLSSRLKQKQALYSHNKDDSIEDTGYEAGSEEGSVEDILPLRKQVQPLVYVLLAQPHTFLSILPFTKKIQMSCFDLSIRMSEPDFAIPRRIPRRDDFSSVLIETKNGDPHPSTGIPPAFLTVKWSQSIGKASVIDLELGRPTKLYGNLSQWYFISAIYEKVSHIFFAFAPSDDSLTFPLKSAPERFSKAMSSRCQSHSFDEKTSGSESPNKLFRDTELTHHPGKQKNSLSSKDKKNTFDLRNSLGDVGSISMTSQQLVFQISGTGHSHEVIMSVAGLKGTVSRIARGQVDRLGGSLGVNCLMLAVTYEGVSRPLLNPWSCSVDVGLAWEPWLMDEASPQVQLTAESDNVLIDVGPEHIHTLELILSEYKPFLESFQSNAENDCGKVTTPSADQDQYYCDDLRAGAFQFVDANNGSSREDLPLPYQVVFWHTPPTMAWRYPQPRALTRVDVFPIPFKVASELHIGQEHKHQILCSLQYWSECQAHYKPYSQFHLSESEMCRLELPVPPHQVVACTWRVQLTLQSDKDDEDDDEEGAEDSSHILVSPHALAACMRVDSFFSPHQVPRFQAALNFSLVQVSLYNHIASSTTTKPLPGPLKQFSVDQLTPESQFFMSFSLDNSTVYVCTWASGDVSVVEFSSHVRSDVVDYAYLMQHCVIEPFQAKAQLTLGDKKTLRCVTKTIAIRFGPAIGHTLAMSADLWTQTFKSFESQNKCTLDNDYQVIVSCYVICNDLSCPLRFGQASTDEDILLGSGQCHFYSWRSQKMKSMLRIGVEEGAWVWSQPFPIDTDGLQLCDLADCGNKVVRVIVKVTSLSVTQKQVTLTGQLVVTNLLAEHLEFQTVAMADKLAGQKSEGPTLVAKAKSTPPSVLLDESSNLALRIRFHGLSSAWSGDIPLRENTKSGQPWLVKVPLHDRGQFLSVWCHMICQPIGHGEKILAMICPLYMIRSHLPIPAKVLIDTPGLKVHLEMTVNGRGEEQQLYCPGTIDHSHKLTFQLESGIPPSNPFVPLSYAMIDQRKYFKREDKDVDIDKILESFQEPPKQVWPFVGEEYADVIWNPVGQPETSIQVKYMPQGPYCSTLLVELQPWALLVNTVGHSVALMAEGNIVCRIPHQGVVTPPKLETTFNLALEMCNTVYVSPPLQLARLDWGSSFYMPRISGLIPNNGNAQTVIPCDTIISILNIASVIVEEMRVITIQANYVISNLTSLNLKVSALAIQDFSKSRDFQKEENQKCVQTLLPLAVDKQTNGCPIVQWSVLGEQKSEGEFALYIMLSAGADWSCPLRVGDGVMRRSFAVPKSDKSELSNHACTLAMHEHNGQTFLSIYPELHPQIVVHNMCRFKILCAEANPENDGIAVPENEHLSWWCTIEPNSSSHYSLPSVSKKFPEILTPGNWPRFVLALAEDEGILVWSRGIIITEMKEQFVHLPGHGDVKVRIQIFCHTVHITVDTVSHVEISARDIRSRLIHHQEDTESIVVEKLYLRPASAPSAPSHGHLSYSSDYLSMSCSSQSHAELPLKITESDASFMSATDSANTAPPELCTSKTSCTSSSSSLFTVTEITNNIELENTIPSDPVHIHASCFLRGLHITLTDDIPKMNAERTEVILLSLDNIYVSLRSQKLTEHSEELNVTVSIGDLQLDNQMYQRGGFDFPVILIGQVPKQHSGHGFTLSTPSHLLEEFAVDSLISIRTSIEMITRKETKFIAMKTLSISCGPLCTYIEDTLIMKLYDFIKCFAPATSTKHSADASTTLTFVPVPKEVYWNSKQVAYPLRLRTLKIQPVSLLLTAHKSLKLYIALNHSPLQFPAFERCNVITTPYQLGHTLTTHYFFGAIFGAGWMLGSLELLGSPGGFARNLGTGLCDFVRLPYRGIFEGPWGFLVGMTHGSASLMKHVTAGTLSSVTNLAASVARNLDILTLDREHLARTEELRRQRPQGVTQGLLRGLTGLGISLLGAVGGIAHHSLQSMMSEGPSTRGLVAGMGLGLVGAITKPLSGAAELVALTGQGLLHGTGWTTMPEVRQHPVMEHAFSSTNSRLKYGWKLITGFGSGRHTLLHVTDATYVTPTGTYKAVALILTTQALFLIDTEEDITKRVLSLTELSGIDQPSDPTLLSFHLQAPIETEAAFHARVVDFVRHTSGMVGNYGAGNQSEADESSSLGSPVNSEQDKSNDILTFYVNPQSRNYFLSVLALAKRQSQSRGFSVL